MQQATRANYENNHNTKKRIQKKTPSTNKQIVIDGEGGAFVATKSAGHYRNVFSTFRNTNKGLDCGMNKIHQSRSFRIEALHNAIPEISSYHVDKDHISFNCLGPINPQLIQADSGIIYFSYDVTNFSPENISIKSAFKQTENDQIEEIESDIPINFRVGKKIGRNNTQITRIKLFPIFLHYGFILNIIDEKCIKTYIILNNPSKGQVGISSVTETKDILSNTIKVFPYLKVLINYQHVWVFIDDKYIPESVKDIDQPCLIEYNYDFQEKKLTAKNNFEYISMESKNE